MALNPSDSNKLASGSDDGLIKVWDIEKGECLKTLNLDAGTVMNLIYVPDTLELISCSTDKTIKILKAETFECVRTLSGHNSNVLSIALIKS